MNDLEKLAGFGRRKVRAALGDANPMLGGE